MGPITIDPSNPVAFFILALLAGIVLVGLYFYGREIVASGMDLHEERKAQRERERKRGGKL